MAKWSGLIFAILFSQSAWLILYGVSTLLDMLSQAIILTVGIVVLACLTVLVWKCQAIPKTEQFKRSTELKIIYWLATAWSWTCVVDLVLYFEAIGVVKNWMDFYFKFGEPYLEFSNGKAMNLWDSVVHYILYLLMVFCIQNGKKSWRSVGLFYCGSMTTGMILLTFGTMSGIFGTQIHLAMFLNTPFFILPFCCLHHLLNLPTKQSVVNKTGVLFLPLFLLLGVCITFNMVRGLAAFDSPNPVIKQYNDLEPYNLNPQNYGKFLAIINSFYGIPFLVMAMKHICCNTSTSTFKNIAWVYAGSVSQTTFLQLYSQFDTTMESQYKPSDNNAILVICLNLTLPLTAYLLLFYLRKNSDTNLQNKVE